MLFGGLGQNIFNPAATGRVFVAICFGDRINEAYHLQGSYDAIASATPLQTNLVQSQYSLFDLFLGNVPGSMGEVSTLLILLGALYLFIRRSADLRAFLGFMLSFMALTFVAVISGFGKVDGQSLFDTYLYQIMAGGALFGATFMITDPVTSPVTKFGRVLFGVIAGSLVVLIRISGALPEGVVFSILIANTLAPTMDYLMRGRKHSYPWQGLLIMGVYLILIGIVISSKVMGGWF
jgi:electron transport complex protein RnfD